eukprot:TRINITY_DN5833_c0_g1_i2.p1 TRINITY_DN5833_c0_g1~~TRINITY_DN5833_c0_g1_i2.p1  ORF type:complete len:411 (+),score=43.50 TRINITY_DN5833_c0_g1_i2:414-1646(+)
MVLAAGSALKRNFFDKAIGLTIALRDTELWNDPIVTEVRIRDQLMEFGNSRSSESIIALFTQVGRRLLLDQIKNRRDDNASVDFVKMAEDCIDGTDSARVCKRVECLLDENVGLVRGVDILAVALSVHGPDSIFCRDKTVWEAGTLYPFYPPAGVQLNWGSAIYYDRRRTSESYELTEVEARSLAMEYLSLRKCTRQRLDLFNMVIDPFDRTGMKQYLFFRETLKRYYIRLSRHDFLAIHMHMTGVSIVGRNYLPRVVDPTSGRLLSDLKCHNFSFRHNVLHKGDGGTSTRSQSRVVLHSNGNPVFEEEFAGTEPEGTGAVKNLKNLGVGVVADSYNEGQWRAELYDRLPGSLNAPLVSPIHSLATQLVEIEKSAGAIFRNSRRVGAIAPPPPPPPPPPPSPPRPPPSWE